MSEEKKQAIRRRFAKAAPSYDEYAVVQKKSAARLAEFLPEKFPATTVLELGCGTGNYTEKLAERFPHARITSVDFAEAMIKLAAKKCKDRHNVSFLCEDGELYLEENNLPFDIISSNATMQWFTDLNQVFFHVARSLTPGGIFLASLFGPQTLYQLGAALSEIFDDSPQLPAALFSDRGAIEQLLLAHFYRMKTTEVFYEHDYPSLHDLLRHMKNTGIGGFHPTLPLLTRGRRKGLEQWFSLRGGFRVTYQVFFLTAAQQGQKQKITRNI